MVFIWLSQSLPGTYMRYPFVLDDDLAFTG